MRVWRWSGTVLPRLCSSTHGEVEEANEVLSVVGVQVSDDTAYTARLCRYRRCFIGRLRATIGQAGGISLFAIGDNLRKGAALNAVELAERLLN